VKGKRDSDEEKRTRNAQPSYDFGGAEAIVPPIFKLIDSGKAMHSLRRENRYRN